MKATREVLEDQAETYERQLAGLRSYLRELRETAARHGTDESLLAEDLLEAEHNVRYYESELARIRSELPGASGSQGPRGGAPPVLPRTVRHGAGTLIFSSLGLIAGMLIGMRMKSRGEGGRG